MSLIFQVTWWTMAEYEVALGIFGLQIPDWLITNSKN